MLQSSYQLRDVGAHLLRETQDLVIRSHARPEQHVVRRLGELTHARGAHMHDVSAERRKHGFRFFERLYVATTEYSERAVVGGLLTEHDRRVEEADPAFRAHRFELACGFG